MLVLRDYDKDDLYESSQEDSLNLRFSEKATKFEKSPTWFRNLYSVTSKPSGRYFQIFWPSQNILTS